MSCGVETITAPVSGTRWERVSCASPVPGGMSISRMSSSPQATSPISCCTALITIGPRQIIAVSSEIRKPIDMQATSHLRIGSSVFSPASAGLPEMPIMRGSEGPKMSLSMRPTASPCRASAAARLTATVDLPTPPLPEATATMLFTPGRSIRPEVRPAAPPGGRSGAGPGRSAVSTTVALVTPGRAASASSTARRSAPASWALPGSTSSETCTAPSLTAMPPTPPMRATLSAAARISASFGPAMSALAPPLGFRDARPIPTPDALLYKASCGKSAFAR